MHRLWGPRLHAHLLGHPQPGSAGCLGTVASQPSFRELVPEVLGRPRMESRSICLQPVLGGSAIPGALEEVQRAFTLLVP